MGRKMTVDSTAPLAAAEADILRTYPGARIKWDTQASPYMVSISVDGALVRGFIEAEALAQRGEVYDAFSRRLSELMTGSMSKAEHNGSDHGSEKLAGTGIRPPLSAAKSHKA